MVSRQERTLEILLKAKNLSAGAFKEVGDSLKRIRAAGREAFAGISRAASSGRAQLLGLVAAAASVQKLVIEPAAFEDSLTRITLAGGEFEDQIEQIRNTIENLAAATGRSRDELAGGFDSAARRVDTFREAVELLENANKLAAVSGTSVQEAVNGLAVVSQVFGDEVGSVEQIAAQLFQTTRKVPQGVGFLLSEIGKIAPVAKNTGVSFEQLLATLEQTGQGGLRATETITSLRNTLDKLANPSGQIGKLLGEIGINFRELNEEGVPLAEIFQRIQRGAEELGVSLREIGTEGEAQPVFFTLADDVAGFEDALARVSGEAIPEFQSAFDRINSTTQSSINAFLELGRVAATAFSGAFLTDLGDGLSEANERVGLVRRRAQIAGLEFRKWAEQIKPAGAVAEAFFESLDLGLKLIGEGGAQTFRGFRLGILQVEKAWIESFNAVARAWNLNIDSINDTVSDLAVRVARAFNLPVPAAAKLAEDAIGTIEFIDPEEVARVEAEIQGLTNTILQAANSAGDRLAPDIEDVQGAFRGIGPAAEAAAFGVLEYERRIDALRDETDKLVDVIGRLREQQERLGDAFPEEGERRLQAYIDRLNGVTVEQREATEAAEGLREALRGVGAATGGAADPDAARALRKSLETARREAEREFQSFDADIRGSTARAIGDGITDGFRTGGEKGAEILARALEDIGSTILKRQVEGILESIVPEGGFADLFSGLPGVPERPTTEGEAATGRDALTPQSITAATDQGTGSALERVLGPRAETDRALAEQQVDLLRTIADAIRDLGSVQRPEGEPGIPTTPTAPGAPEGVQAPVQAELPGIDLGALQGAVEAGTGSALDRVVSPALGDVRSSLRGASQVVESIRALSQQQAEQLRVLVDGVRSLRRSDLTPEGELTPGAAATPQEGAGAPVGLTLEGVAQGTDLGVGAALERVLAPQVETLRLLLKGAVQRLGDGNQIGAQQVQILQAISDGIQGLRGAGVEGLPEVPTTAASLIPDEQGADVATQVATATGLAVQEAAAAGTRQGAQEGSQAGVTAALPAFEGVVGSLGSTLVGAIGSFVSALVAAQTTQAATSFFAQGSPNIGGSFRPVRAFASGGKVGGKFLPIEEAARSAGVDVRAFAGGGILRQPTLGIIAEGKMDEAVVPLPDGQSIPVKFENSDGGVDFATILQGIRAAQAPLASGLSQLAEAQVAVAEASVPAAQAAPAGAQSSVQTVIQQIGQGGASPSGDSWNINISAIDGASVTRMLSSPEGRRSIESAMRQARSTKRDFRR